MSLFVGIEKNEKICKWGRKRCVWWWWGGRKREGRELEDENVAGRESQRQIRKRTEMVKENLKEKKGKKRGKEKTKKTKRK